MKYGYIIILKIFLFSLYFEEILEQIFQFSYLFKIIYNFQRYNLHILKYSEIYILPFYEIR